MTDKNQNVTPKTQESGGNQSRTELQTSQTSMARPNRGLTPFSLARSPFAMMQQMFDDLDALWTGSVPWGSAERGQRAFVPQIEVSRKNDQILVKCDLPGMSPDDVEVSVEQGQLVISGERHSAHEHDDSGSWQCEREYGMFRRVIALPDGADASSAQAHFNNGVLEVSIRAPEQARGRKVEIQHGSPPRETH